MIGRACLCGAAEASLVHSGVRHDPETTVWRCAACDLVYAWPRPSTEELARYYVDGYRLEYGAVPPEELRRVGEDDSRARAERLEELLGPDTAVLDVGAGVGTFLDAIAGRIAEATAIEPDAGSRAYIAERLGVPAVAALADLPADARFDVVTLFHVLEHVSDPPAFLRELAALLRPGGSIVVEVPNVDDALVSVYPGDVYPAFYFQKAHLFYFSPATLARTAEDAALRGDVALVQRYGLRNHLHWLANGEPGGDTCYRDTVSQGADAAYRDSLVRSGHADTLWLVAGRPAP